MFKLNPYLLQLFCACLLLSTLLVRAHDTVARQTAEEDCPTGRCYQNCITRHSICWDSSCDRQSERIAGAREQALFKLRCYQMCDKLLAWCVHNMCDTQCPPYINSKEASCRSVCSGVLTNNVEGCAISQLGSQEYDPECIIRTVDGYNDCEVECDEAIVEDESETQRAACNNQTSTGVPLDDASNEWACCTDVCVEDVERKRVECTALLEGGDNEQGLACLLEEQRDWQLCLESCAKAYEEKTGFPIGQPPPTIKRY